MLIGWFTADRASRCFLCWREGGLAALGLKEGSQFVFEERWADGIGNGSSRGRTISPLKTDDPRRGILPQAAWPRLQEIPIVQADCGDPVGNGLVSIFSGLAA